MARPADGLKHEERPAPASDRSLGELFGDLSRETSELVRAEVTLAKAEMSEKAAKAGKDVGYLAVGGMIAYAGLLALVATVILALAQLGVTWWLSALIVGVVVAGIGGFLVMSGLKQLKQLNPKPEQTIDSLREDAQWAKTQIG